MPGGVGVDEGSDEFGWVVAKDKPKYDEIFNTLEQEKGKVTGEIRKNFMIRIKTWMQKNGKELHCRPSRKGGDDEVTSAQQGDKSSGFLTNKSFTRKQSDPGARQSVEACGHGQRRDVGQ